jgi:hypothetical protein
MSPRRRGIQVRPWGTDGARGVVWPERAARGAIATLGVAIVLDLALPAGRAGAFTVSLTPAAPQEIYLQVGDGLFTGGNYTPIEANGKPTGTPGVNPTIDVMSVSVAANAVGNGTAQAMTTNSTAANSYWNGRLFCNLAQQQLYIGGFYRTHGAGTNTATVTATLPASLTDTTGDSIPFSQISWTAGGNGDTGAEPFPAGSFSSTSLTVGSIGQNQWAESCWTFSYQNSVLPAAGTYTGRVTYTLSAP